MGGVNVKLPNKQFYSIDTGEESFYLYNYEKTLYSLKNNERMPLGNSDIKSDEFEILDKNIYKDYIRKKHTVNDNLCTQNFLFYYYNDDDNKYISISEDDRSVYSDACDDKIRDICLDINNNSLDANYSLICKKWISSLLYKNDTETINNILLKCQYKNNVGNESCIYFINELRKYATLENDYNFFADNYLMNIKDYAYLPCAFPSEEVIEEEKKLKKNKECWYKGCIFTEKWKLSTKNLQSMQECDINICDINIGLKDDTTVTNLISKCLTEYKFKEKFRKDKAVVIDKIKEFNKVNFNYYIFILVLLGVFI